MILDAPLPIIVDYLSGQETVQGASKFRSCRGNMGLQLDKGYLGGPSGRSCGKAFERLFFYLSRSSILVWADIPHVLRPPFLAECGSKIQEGGVWEGEDIQVSTT